MFSRRHLLKLLGIGVPASVLGQDVLPNDYVVEDQYKEKQLNERFTQALWSDNPYLSPPLMHGTKNIINIAGMTIQFIGSEGLEIISTKIEGRLVYSKPLPQYNTQLKRGVLDKIHIGPEEPVEVEIDLIVSNSALIKDVIGIFHDNHYVNVAVQQTVGGKVIEYSVDGVVYDTMEYSDEGYFSVSGRCIPPNERIQSSR